MADKLSKQELWEAVQREGSVRAAGRAMGVPESTLRGRLKGYNPDLPVNAFVPGPEHMPASHVDEHGVETRDYTQRAGIQRYILTSAQNNCDVHKGFLQNLEAFAQHMNAEMLVSFSIYDRAGYRGLVRKGDSKLKSHEVWWDEAIKPYICNARVRLHRRLAFCGELDILATAKNPLSGLESYCGRSSIIVPHNRFAFQCVDSRKHQMPKEMATTGSITKRRFIQRKTGQVAQFHHVLGALLVEVDEEGYWYIHHINADEDGSFYWLDTQVDRGEVVPNHQGVAGIVLGDVHYEKANETQSSIAYELVEEYKPDAVVVHDLIDFRSRNHHDRGSPFKAIKTAYEQVRVEEEVETAGAFIDALNLVAPDAEVVVARSNHDEAFDRWIRETDWRSDPVNAEFYLRTALALVERVNTDRPLNALQWAIQEYKGLAPDAKFLGLDESYEITDIECGIHGHVGPRGTRGSPRAYSKLGFKTFTAHTHTPSIIDGCYTVGVLGNLDMGYNKGPSNWMHVHGLIYPNGKRAFAFVKNGKWAADPH